MGVNECRYDLESFAEGLEVDIESISGLFSEYINEMKSEVIEMRTFLEKSDWYMLQRIVHNVKGVSANLNVHDVFNEAEKLDLLLKNGQTEEAKGLVDSITELLESAEIEIKNFFSLRGFSI